MYIPAGITTSDIGSISGTGADNRIPTFTDATNIQGEANLTFDGSTLTVTGALTVGVDDTGHDVKFFGATSGRYMLWDESEDYLIFPDNVKAVFGTGGDLSIYHDSNHSYISDQGTGNIAILANDFQVNNAANNENMISATQDGAVALNYNGATKFATTAAGVNVADDLLVTLGTNDDSVFTHQNSALGIHAELSNVVEGTSAHPAYAANSLLISNITDDGDIGFLTSDGGNSRGLLTLDGSAGKVVMMTASTQSATPDYSGAVGAELYLQSNGTGGGVGTGGTLEFGTTMGNGTPFAMIKGYIQNGTTYTSGILMFSVRDAYDSESLTKAMQIGADSQVNMYGALEVAGEIYADNGITIGDTTSTNNVIDDASTGSGTTTLYVGNASITVSSDARLKTDIEATSIDALNLIDELNVVDFGWNDPTDTSKYGKNYRGKYVGMLAQETIKVAPWVINDQGGGKDCQNCMAELECESHGMFQVEYQHLVPTLVKAIQELRQELQEVKRGNR